MQNFEQWRDGLDTRERNSFSYDDAKEIWNEAQKNILEEANYVMNYAKETISANAPHDLDEPLSRSSRSLAMIDSFLSRDTEGGAHLEMLPVISHPKGNPFTSARDWRCIGTVGHVDVLRVWISLDSEEVSANVYQCMLDEPSKDMFGYVLLEDALNKADDPATFSANAFAPPEGWICASEYTKDMIYGAIFEKIIGCVEDGFAPYHMTIARSEDDQAFTPIHGMVKMDFCSSARQAGVELQNFWDHLPDDHKMIAKRNRETSS